MDRESSGGREILRTQEKVIGMLRFVLYLVLGFVIYRWLRNLMAGSSDGEKKSSVEGKRKTQPLDLRKEDVQDARFEDIEDQKRPPS